MVSESPAPARKWGKEIRNLRQRSRRYNNRERRPRKKNQKEKDQNRWLISKPREFEFEELKSGKKWLPWQKFFENFKHEFPGRWLVQQFFDSACFFCVLMSKLPINNGQLFYNYLFVSQLVSSRFVRLCPPIIDGPRAYDRPSTVKKNHKIHGPQTLSTGIWILKVQTDKL